MYKKIIAITSLTKQITEMLITVGTLWSASSKMLPVSQLIPCGQPVVKSATSFTVDTLWSASINKILNFTVNTLWLT